MGLARLNHVAKEGLRLNLVRCPDVICCGGFGFEGDGSD